MPVEGDTFLDGRVVGTKRAVSPDPDLSAQAKRTGNAELNGIVQIKQPIVGIKEKFDERRFKEIPALDRVATLTEDYVPAHYTRGQVLTALGDTTAAVAAYENFLSRWQGNPEAARVVTLQMEALR